MACNDVTRVLGALAYSQYVPIAITNVWGVRYQESRLRFDQLPLPCNCAFNSSTLIAFLQATPNLSHKKTGGSVRYVSSVAPRQARVATC